MKPEVIAGIALLVCCLSSSSAGGAYFIMNASPEPSPEESRSQPETTRPNIEDAPGPGCTDSDANNTTPGAIEDNSICLYDRKAAFKFTGNNGKSGCYYKNENNMLIQAECSPELEQAEFDVITDYKDNITEVKTCFVEDDVVTYNKDTGIYDKVSSTRKSIKIGDENESGTECKMFRVGPVDGTDIIGEKRIIGYSDSLGTGSPLVSLVDKDEDIPYGHAPVKLQLI